MKSITSTSGVIIGATLASDAIAHCGAHEAGNSIAIVALVLSALAVLSLSVWATARR